MFQKINRTIGICAAFILVLATFARGGVAGNYVNLPRSPNSTEDRTIAFPIKGVVVYITPDERDRLDWIGYVQICAGLVVGIAFIINRIHVFGPRR
jgi:hypothetical protein